MGKLTFILIILLASLSTKGQVDSVEVIDDLIYKINNSGLTKKEFNSNDVYNQVTDNGGQVTVTYEGNKIKKIENEVGLSWGFSSTTFYFENEKPIKIIEIEKNYEWKETESEFDYSKLNEVFRWEYYIFNYDFDQGKINRVGEPKFTEPTCGLFEYEPTIELIKNYANKGDD